MSIIYQKISHPLKNTAIILILLRLNVMHFYRAKTFSIRSQKKTILSTFDAASNNIKD